MASELTAVTVAVATVWHFGGRRYLTKRAAFGAKAKAWMMRRHQDAESDEWFDDHCDCLWCRDRFGGGKRVHRRLARYLMRSAATVAKGQP